MRYIGQAAGLEQFSRTSDECRNARLTTKEKSWGKQNVVMQAAFSVNEAKMNAGLGEDSPGIAARESFYGSQRGRRERRYDRCSNIAEEGRTDMNVSCPVRSCQTRDAANKEKPPRTTSI